MLTRIILIYDDDLQVFLSPSRHVTFAFKITHMTFRGLLHLALLQKPPVKITLRQKYFTPPLIGFRAYYKRLLAIRATMMGTTMTDTWIRVKNWTCESVWGWIEEIAFIFNEQMLSTSSPLPFWRTWVFVCAVFFFKWNDFCCYHIFENKCVYYCEL